MAGGLGFEPRLMESESITLPFLELVTKSKGAFMNSIQKSSESVTKSKWGGSRPGAGRKRRHFEATITMRIPLSKLDEVKRIISKDENHSDFKLEIVTNSNICLNCETKSKLEFVTNSINVWKQKIFSREQKPRWHNVSKLLKELELLL